MRSLSRLLLVVCAVLGAAGCVGNFATVAPGPPPSYEEIARPAQAWGCGTLLFGWIPIGVNDRAEEAYEQARKSIGAAGLTNVSVVDRWSWIFIGWRLCSRVDGTGFRTLRPTK